MSLADEPSTIGEVAKSGHLTKKGVGILAKTKRRWFTIRGEVLSYYKEETTVEADDVGADAAGHIPLIGSTIDKDLNAKSEFAFVVALPNKGRVYELNASSETELWSWIVALRTIAAKRKRHDLSIGLPSENTEGSTIISYHVNVFAMTSQRCAEKVERALLAVNGVQSAAVNLEDEFALVMAERWVDPEAFLVALETIGYVPVLR